MIVLSLFDGISAGQLALKRAGIVVDKYYASEIDKYAIQVTQKNWPETIQLGDVTKWREWNIETPDIIIGGSPCQGFSFAGKQLNFNDPRSKLFFKMVDILKHYKPKYYLLENVKMKKEYKDIITEHMGVEPMEINSALVSAQNRKRLYWFNWDVAQPADKGIVLRDVLEYGGAAREKGQTILSTIYKENAKSMLKRGKIGLLAVVPGRVVGRAYNEDGRRIDHKGSVAGKTSQVFEANKNKEKTNTISTVGKDNILAVVKDNGKYWQGEDNHGQRTLVQDKLSYRKLTPIECERLQTFPDNYTEGVSKTQRYKALGNSWTVDVVAHIFRGLR